ncbi:DUF92 domain-containing protein [Paenibacillus sp. BSR1-1]|uniref:DUF92 domain-containing protein n=1 Tax=Paenibacillus sp. BSR1-1 TaxID=3020845 RepID=UPI0025B0EC39|nr:DUF92 domain-containing protein [Paenibacillus sp. BSR1-1]MDN3018529.1 DUF92 domain-containing protein [Paenibacillus sp. BSR1-1]
MILITGASGYLLNSLTKSGAIAAFLTGLAVYIGFGVKGLFLLGAFFATSSLWSKYKSAAKASIEEKLAKGTTRDWRQVAANGGAAALFSIIYYFHNDSLWLMGFSVSLASANSDTWASEIGSLSRNNPIYIRTFKRIEKGTSGAISLLGSAAAISGALLIAILTMLLFHLPVYEGLIIFLFGYLGNVIDTLVGAYYQQEYRCVNCGIHTEKKVHCGKPATRIKGVPFVDNDMVNFLSGSIAAILAIWLIRLSF